MLQCFTILEKKVQFGGSCNDYMYQMFVSWTELGETNIDLSLWLIYRIHALIFHVPFRIQTLNFIIDINGTQFCSTISRL